MFRVGRRKFLASQVQVLSALFLSGCRTLSWFEKDRTSNNEASKKSEMLGLENPPVEQVTRANTSLKETARQDYAGSLKDFGGRLSQPSGELKASYDVVIIGSGYGAAITAARIAPMLAPGKTICIIERGREWSPGDFPDTFSDYKEEVTAKNPLGLYDINVGLELDVIQASGLGGTSLINANVAAIPDPEVFASTRWPLALRNINTLKPYYERAIQALGAKPTSPESSGKAKTMKYLGQNLPHAVKSFEAANITVTTETPSTPNSAGMTQRACTFCGDCMSGCNVGAKNTLVYNYLPIAKRAGANIFTELSVMAVRPEGQNFVVSYNKTTNTTSRWWEYLLGGLKTKTDGEIRARLVILGAGSLGSTGILLRSQSMLLTSPKLGHNFSGNGDAFAIYQQIEAAGLNAEPNIGGKGAYDTTPGPGPTIQTIIKVNPASNLSERVVIEDLSVPRAFVPSLEFAIKGKATNSMFLLGIGHDDADGRIELSRLGTPRVTWPGLNQKPYFFSFNRLFQSVESIFKAKIPFWKTLLMRYHHETAHPLGGCNMADTVTEGVVNDKCQVFRPDGSVYKNLYVIDGAVIPTSLGINPFLTISAVAERAAEGIIADPAHADLFRTV